MTRSSLLSRLPPPDGRFQTIAESQTVSDIIGEVLAAHRQFAGDYDKLAEQFTGGDAIKKLYDFCKKNIAYDVESEALQTTRSPGALLAMGACDCKGYAGFIAGILDALNRQSKVAGPKFDWRYRFANYDTDSKTPGHVFVVVRKPSGEEIWIDPVLNGLNSRHPAPLSYTDKKPAEAMGALVRISGMMGATDQYLPVPTNYPGNLPRPVLTADGKLVLRGTIANYTDQDIQWMQVALQPLIIEYAPKPYNIFWSIPNWGSGKAHVMAATTPISKLFHHNTEEDFLQYPSMPTGWDDFTTMLGAIVPSLLGIGANAVIPGSGGLVASYVTGDIGLSGGSNTSVNLTPEQMAYYNNTSPVQVDVVSTVKNFVQANPVVTIGIAAAVAYLLYEILKD